MKLKRGKKSGLAYFSIADIRAWEPCYDPKRYIPEDWRGTSVDVLKDERIPPADRLWVVLRTEIVSERVMRLFAVWCARQVQHLMTDKRSTDAIDVAASSFFRAYVHTEQTLETTLSGLLWIHGYGKGIVRTVGPTRVRLHGV